MYYNLRVVDNIEEIFYSYNSIACYSDDLLPTLLLLLSKFATYRVFTVMTSACWSNIAATNFNIEIFFDFRHFPFPYRSLSYPSDTFFSFSSLPSLDPAEGPGQLVHDFAICRMHT